MSALRKIQKSLHAQRDSKAKDALKAKRAIEKALAKREKERESRHVKIACRRWR